MNNKIIQFGAVRSKVIRVHTFIRFYLYKCAPGQCGIERNNQFPKSNIGQLWTINDDMDRLMAAA